jgi:hypothetical protein
MSKKYKKEIVKEIIVTELEDRVYFDAVCYKQKVRVPRKLKKQNNA